MLQHLPLLSLSTLAIAANDPDDSWARSLSLSDKCWHVNIGQWHAGAKLGLSIAVAISRCFWVMCPLMCTAWFFDCRRQTALIQMDICIRSLFYTSIFVPNILLSISLFSGTFALSPYRIAHSPSQANSRTTTHNAPHINLTRLLEWVESPKRI